MPGWDRQSDAGSARVMPVPRSSSSSRMMPASCSVGSPPRMSVAIGRPLRRPRLGRYIESPTARGISRQESHPAVRCWDRSFDGTRPVRCQGERHRRQYALRDERLQLTRVEEFLVRDGVPGLCFAPSLSSMRNEPVRGRQAQAWSLQRTASMSKRDSGTRCSATPDIRCRGPRSRCCPVTIYLGLVG